jgi:dienelactone hydrolase
MLETSRSGDDRAEQLEGKQRARVELKAGLIALVLLCAPPALAQVDLAFPRQPEREVKLPGRGAFTGAKLYAPREDGPFPAVVLSHTCGPLRQHIFEWAQRFLSAGYVVLVVDHLGPRGLGTNCSDFSVSVTEYAQDDVAGLRHLRSMPFVHERRIAQLGLSYGAMAGLREASESFRAKYLGGERFAAIVSLYPWCNQQGGPRYRDHQWNFYDDTNIPLLVLLGADDDEADPRSCVEKAKQNAAKGMPVEFKVFPNTTHAFDHSLMGNKPVVAQQGNRTVTYRYNRDAVEASWKLIVDFLGRHVGGNGAR